MVKSSFKNLSKMKNRASYKSQELKILKDILLPLAKKINRIVLIHRAQTIKKLILKVGTLPEDSE